MGNEVLEVEEEISEAIEEDKNPEPLIVIIVLALPT